MKGRGVSRFRFYFATGGKKSEFILQIHMCLSVRRFQWACMRHFMPLVVVYKAMSRKIFRRGICASKFILITFQNLFTNLIMKLKGLWSFIEKSNYSNTQLFKKKIYPCAFFIANKLIITFVLMLHRGYIDIRVNKINVFWSFVHIFFCQKSFIRSICWHS